MKDSISVKEYAALHGMTEQAVYKRIRAGKLETIEHRENGKRKRLILLDPAGSNPVSDPDTVPAARTPDPHPGDAAAAGDPLDPGRRSDPAAATGTAARTPDPHPGDAAAAGDPLDPGRAGSAQRPPEVAALEMAIETLTAQLAEKDKQIERLTELLYREQELQANSHRLLTTAARAPDPHPGDAAAAGAPLDPEAGEALPQEQKKRSFWYRLFH